MSKPTFGIDLGTTFSSIGYLSGTNPTIVGDISGSKAIPSIVCYTDDYPIVGHAAAHMMGDYTDTTIYDTKRMLGRRFSGDPEIERLRKELPFDIISDSRTDEVLIQLPANQSRGPKTIHPYEASSEILKYMIELANETIPQKDRGMDCVVTVPANWGERPREETRKAAKKAGLNIKQLVNEPTAAAVAYRDQILDEGQGSKKQTIIIFDFGGGTLDVSLMEMEGLKFDVKAVAGNPRLGGRDFDRCLMEYVIQQNKYKHLRPRDLDKIKKVCCDAKCSLSKAPHCMMYFENINNRDVPMKLTRSSFESICKPLFDQILEPVENVLEQKKLNKRSIDNVIMVGGSSFIPKVSKILSDYFGKEPIRFPDPQMAVVQGAAIIAAKYSNLEMNGVSIQEVCSSTIGIRVIGGVMSPVIPQGTKIPCTREKTFVTGTYDQETACFDMYEGEWKMAKYNNLITAFNLSGIPKGAPGKPLNFKLTFDEDGILHATASCNQNGKQATITVDKNSNQYSSNDLQNKVTTKRVTKKEDEEEARVASILANMNVYYESILTFIGKPEQSYLKNITSLQSQLISSISQLEGRKTAENNEPDKAKQIWKAKLIQAGLKNPPSWI